MALEAGIDLTQHFEYNEEISGLAENEQEEPLLIYPQADIETNCPFVLHPHSNGSIQSLNVPHGDYFHLENPHNSHLSNGYSLEDNFQCTYSGVPVDDNLAVFEFLCSNRNDPYLPEFVDINTLSQRNMCDYSNNVDVFCVSDDDDVVFVKEYKCERVENREQVVKKAEEESNASPEKNVNLKRNPVRKTRINTTKLSKEPILEENFILLDTTDEEEKEDQKENKPPNNIPLPAIEPPKKKPRLETVPVTRKSNNNRSTKKRKPRASRAKKVPISKLKPLVSSTTEMMANFFQLCKESRELIGNGNSEICSFENKSEVLRNQIILYTVVNDFDQDKAIQQVADMVGTDNDAKK